MEDDFNFKKDPRIKIGDKKIGRVKDTEMSIEKRSELVAGSLESNLSYEVSLNMAKQKDKLIWKAAKQKAEAVVFSEDYEVHQDIRNEKELITSEKYAICNKISEIYGYIEENPYWIEIPVYAQRIAEETDSFEEFQREMQIQSPKGEL